VRSTSARAVLAYGSSDAVSSTSSTSSAVSTGGSVERRSRHVTQPPPDEPDGVTRELRVPWWFESIHCADQRDASLLDEIGERHSEPAECARLLEHDAQVRLDESRAISR
jgi:hypothetical protein